MATGHESRRVTRRQKEDSLIAAQKGLASAVRALSDLDRAGVEGMREAANLAQAAWQECERALDVMDAPRP